MNKKTKIKIFANVNIVLGVVSVLAATITVLFIGFPRLFYVFNISSSEGEVTTLTQSLNSDFESYKRLQPDPEEYVEEIPEYTAPKLKPKLDFSLPSKKTLNIPKISVNGEIFEGEDYDTLLEKGIWRANEFGTPEDEIVMILASHRFGHITWTNEYRNKNSFLNLPKTNVGDYIEIVWNQRLYTYEIYKVEEGQEITDYSADLILYTCKLYNSPERIFRYANRTN